MNLSAEAFLAARPVKRHQYFHHLNSSQAFAFNLFFPYFTGGADASAALLRALGQMGVLTEWEPEKVPVVEEGTNIDMFWATSDGTETFCEVKLSEADFGTAKDDDRHRKKLSNIYSPTLAGHLIPERLEPAAFFSAYQFNRNVWHIIRAGERSRLVFLLPRANVGLWEQLHRLLSGVAHKTRERISAVSVEDAIADLIADDRCPERLRKYGCKLKRKYVIPTG